MVLPFEGRVADELNKALDAAHGHRKHDLPVTET
jgi:hypothetical protein